MANGATQSAEQVSVNEAIGRSLYQQVSEKSGLMAREIGPHLNDIAVRLEEDLGAFGYEIVRKKPAGV